jgi:hypothetical protein
MKEAQQQGETGARKYEEFGAELAEGFQAGLVSADVLNRIWHLQAALRKPEVQRGMQGVKVDAVAGIDHCVGLAMKAKVEGMKNRQQLSITANGGR